MHERYAWIIDHVHQAGRVPVAGITVFCACHLCAPHCKAPRPGADVQKFIGIFTELTVSAKGAGGQDHHKNQPSAGFHSEKVVFTGEQDTT